DPQRHQRRHRIRAEQSGAGSVRAVDRRVAAGLSRDGDPPMPIAVSMPALSPTMTEGTLAKWLIKEGDKVIPGKAIAEIEKDKATMEVEAIDEGVLGRIEVPQGTEHVAVNTVIAWILEDGESQSAIPKAAGGAPPAAAKAPEARPAPAPQPAPAAL